jgi:hypothetical protein
MWYCFAQVLRSNPKWWKTRRLIDVSPSTLKLNLTNGVQMSYIEQAANTAIFQRQLPFDRAVRFVVQDTGVKREQAETALRSVMLWYRN